MVVFSDAVYRYSVLRQMEEQHSSVAEGSRQSEESDEVRLDLHIRNFRLWE